jgi:hypothetical protein
MDHAEWLAAPCFVLAILAIVAISSWRARRRFVADPELARLWEAHQRNVEAKHAQQRERQRACAHERTRFDAYFDRVHCDDCEGHTS